MPTSRFCVLLLFLMRLAGQSLLLSVPEENLRLEVPDARYLPVILDSLQDLHADLGLGYELQEFQLTKTLEIRYGQRRSEVILDSLVFTGGHGLRPAILRQLFRPLLHTRPAGESRRAFEHIRNGQPYLDRNTKLSFHRHTRHGVAGVIHLNPVFESHISGIMGLARAGQEGWITTGQLDLHFENLWQTAGIIDINWQRRDTLSQRIRFAVEEPYPLGLPFGAAYAFTQDLVQGLYVSRRLSGAVVFPWGIIGKLYLGAGSLRIIPTESGTARGTPALTSRSLVLSSFTDRRDNRYLPNSGGTWDLTLEAGTRNSGGSSGLVLRYDLHMEQNVDISRRAVATGKLAVTGAALRRGDLHAGELVRYGGAESLRGYYEEFFAGPWVAIPQLELAYLPAAGLRVFAFTDLAVQTVYQPLPFGWGWGLIQKLPRTLIELTYALGRGDRWRSAKLHIQVTSLL